CVTASCKTSPGTRTKSNNCVTASYKMSPGTKTKSNNCMSVLRLKASSYPNIRSKSSRRLASWSGISKLKLSNCQNVTSKWSNCVIVLANCQNVTSKWSNCVIVLPKSIIYFIGGA